MLYAIIATDYPNTVDKRRDVRPRHMEYIKQLIDAGRVILAGPHPAIDSSDPGPAGMTGSLIVAEFASIGEAQAWSQSDPYVTEGVFQDVMIKPFNRVYP